MRKARWLLVMDRVGEHNARNVDPGKREHSRNWWKQEKIKTSGEAHYTGKTTNNESGLTPSIGHDKPRTLNALLSANVVSHWAKEQIALDLILTCYSIHSATPGWTTLLSSVSFICFPISRLAISMTFRFGTPPKSLNKWDAVDMNLGLTFITPHKVIVPTYGWINKESPPKNLTAQTPEDIRLQPKRNVVSNNHPKFQGASCLLVLGCVNFVQSLYFVCVPHGKDQMAQRHSMGVLVYYSPPNLLVVIAIYGLTKAYWSGHSVTQQGNPGIAVLWQSNNSSSPTTPSGSSDTRLPRNNNFGWGNIIWWMVSTTN